MELDYYHQKVKVEVASQDATAFSPLGGPMCPHKKKRLRILNAHSIFAAGRAFMPTQEKERPRILRN